MAVEDILEIMQALIITGIAVTEALVDTLMSALSTVVNALQQLGTIDIPILSTLWKLLTKSSDGLTYVDLLAFVLAFPVTLLYKAFTGSYPSQASSASQAVTISASLPVQVATDVMSLASAASLIMCGYTIAVIDAVATLNSAFPPPNIVVQRAYSIVSLISLIVIAGDGTFVAVESQDEWVILEAAVLCLNPVMLFVGLYFPKPASLMNSLFNAMGIVFSALAFADTNTHDVLTLSRRVVASFAPLINPVKFVPPQYLVGYLAALADISCRWAAGGIQLFQSYTRIKDRFGEVQQVHRVYLPMVATH